MQKQITLYASAARTATPTAVVVDAMDYVNPDEKTHLVSVTVVTNTTAIAATPSVTCLIGNYNPIADAYYDIEAGTTITATGTNLTHASLLGGGFQPTNKFRVTMSHADADSITYSVHANLEFSPALG